MAKSQSDVEYNIRRFDVTRMDRSRSCVFIGGSGTGKSHLMTSIMYANRDIAGGIVMSGTEEGDPYWRNFIPDTFIYNDWKPDILEQLIEIQKKKKRAVEAVDQEIEYCRRNGRVADLQRLTQKKHGMAEKMRKFVVLDDLAYKGGLTRNDTIRKLFMNGRHWGILALLSIQYCIALDISLRGNAGYIFICRESIISYRRKIYESFVGMVPSFSVFEKLMDACTQDYECLVVDRTQKSTRVEDVLFWYKAQPSYSFRIGDARLWDYHRTRYDANYEERLAQQAKAKRARGVINKTS